MEWIDVIIGMALILGFIFVWQAKKAGDKLWENVTIERLYRMSDIIEFIKNEQHEYEISLQREMTADEVIEELENWHGHSTYNNNDEKDKDNN